MNKYTIYCTEEQTKKALELGAPIVKIDTRDKMLIYGGNKCYPIIADYPYAIPTTEQMVSWLEEQGLRFTIQSKNEDVTFGFCLRDSKRTEVIDVKGGYNSRKGTMIAVIDAALKYLSDNNLIK